MCDEISFLHDVRLHEMEIIRDDGVYQHIRFKRDNSSSMYFDLITWPGHLCYTGDMGTYVFQRLPDMFTFFRTDRDYALKRGLKLGINLSYWGEKLVATDKPDGYKEFDVDAFDRHVMEYLVNWIRDHAWKTTKSERRELWENVVDQVINTEGDGGGFRKQCAAHDFYFKVNDVVGEFTFQDFWEYDCTKYTFRYMWCCYALAWGIQKYDEAKTGVA